MRSGTELSQLLTISLPTLSCKSVFCVLKRNAIILNGRYQPINKYYICFKKSSAVRHP